MLKRVIAGHNIMLGAPRGWDEARDGPCVGIAARIVPPCAARGVMPMQYCETAWEPTPDELAWLAAGGHLVLRTRGLPPPLYLYVEPPPAEEPV